MGTRGGGSGGIGPKSWAVRKETVAIPKERCQKAGHSLAAAWYKGPNEWPRDPPSDVVTRQGNRIWEPRKP